MDSFTEGPRKLVNLNMHTHTQLKTGSLILLISDKHDLFWFDRRVKNFK